MCPIMATSVQDSEDTCGSCQQPGHLQTLSCQHSFCPECLQKLDIVLRLCDGKHMMVCSTCNKLSEVPESDNRLVSKCSKHLKSREIFCDTCNELVCLQCAIVSHQEHQYDIIYDALPKQRQEMELLLQMLHNKVSATDTKLQALKSNKSGIAKHKDEIIRNINFRAECAINEVQNNQKKTVGRVEQISQLQLQVLDAQIEEAAKALNQLELGRKYLQQCLQINRPSSILSEKQSIQEKRKECEQVDPETFKPVVENNMTFTAEKMQLKLGRLQYTCLPAECSLSIEPIEPIAGKKVDATCTLSLMTKLGSVPPISYICPRVTCSACPDQALACDVTEIERGKYFVSFIPSLPGQHQLYIQAKGIVINNNCLSFEVLSPEMRGKPTRIISALKHPEGITIDEKGQLLVAEWSGHCVTLFDKEGGKIKSIGSHGTQPGKFTHPQGVAINQAGHILVTDEYRLQKLTYEGDYIKFIGSSEAASELEKFKKPRGIAINPVTGQIYIADDYNYCVKVFNDDFTYSHSIADCEKGKIKNPFDVAFDSKGNLYIVDCFKDHIDVLTADGKHLYQIGDCELAKPSSVAIDIHDYVYVSEYESGHIAIFKTDGQFIGRISNILDETTTLKSPRCVRIDKGGNLYISDNGNNRVVIL